MFNGFLNICVGFGMGATIAIYLVGEISGANLNPAASLALCIIGRLEWVAFPVYCLGKCLKIILSQEKSHLVIAGYVLFQTIVYCIQKSYM